MQTKKCTKCGRELPITEFYANKTSKGGYHSYCKECFNRISNENRKKRKQRQAEEEKAKKDSLPWEAILNEPTLPLPEDQDIKEIAKAMNGFKNPAVNEPKAPVKEKTLDDFKPREIFKHLYKLGYRLKDPKSLYCIIKQPVNLEDIINNG
jgi:hypothetical protein